MSDDATAPGVDPVEADDAGYAPPAEKSIDAILEQDKEDDALQKYKAALLGR